MKLVIAIFLGLMLSACGSNPVKTSFPDLPTKLMVEPTELKTIQANSIETIKLDDSSASDLRLSVLETVVAENYKLANQWREQILNLQLWIKTQKALNP